MRASTCSDAGSTIARVWSCLERTRSALEGVVCATAVNVSAARRIGNRKCLGSKRDMLGLRRQSNRRTRSSFDDPGLRIETWGTHDVDFWNLDEQVFVFGHVHRTRRTPRGTRRSGAAKRLDHCLGGGHDPVQLADGEMNGLIQETAKTVQPVQHRGGHAIYAIHL